MSQSGATDRERMRREMLTNYPPATEVEGEPATGVSGSAVDDDLLNIDLEAEDSTMLLHVVLEGETVALCGARRIVSLPREVNRENAHSVECAACRTIWDSHGGVFDA